jgi:hypothetical protein
MVRAARAIVAAIVVGTELAACNALTGIGNYAVGDAMPDGMMPNDGTDGEAAETSAEAGGCAADLAVDPANCGRCGHGCQGGACTGGMCQPVVMHGGLDFPLDVAVDNALVFWPSPASAGAAADAGPTGYIEECSKQGCDAGSFVLASKQGTPYYLAVDDTRVYFTTWDDGAIRAISKYAAGTPATIVSGLQHPFYIALDANTIYWVDFDQGTVESCPKTGCGNVPKVLASGQSSPQGLAVGGTTVYWSTGSTIMSVPTDGGAVTQLVGGQDHPGAITVAAPYVYWSANSTNGAILRCTVGACDAGTVATGFQYPAQIAVDGPDLYWIASGLPASASGVLMQLRGDGGAPVTLAASQPYPHALAIDGTTIYWVNAGSAPNFDDGALMKIAKP